MIIEKSKINQLINSNSNLYLPILLNSLASYWGYTISIPRSDIYANNVHRRNILYIIIVKYLYLYIKKSVSCYNKMSKSIIENGLSEIKFLIRL